MKTEGHITYETDDDATNIDNLETLLNRFCVEHGTQYDGSNKIIQICTDVGTVVPDKDGDLYDPNEEPDRNGDRAILDCYEAFNWLTGVRLFY